MNKNEIDKLIEDMPIPDIRPLPANSWKNKLYLAYAFMHNDQAESGDISFLDKTDGEEVLVINRESFPETIDEFIDKVEQAKATQFHARCQYDEYYSIALITDEYDFMSRMFMCGIEHGCYIHAGAVEKEDVVNKICNQTADNYEALLLGKKLMPIYHRPNPTELINKYIPIKEGKIHIDYSYKRLTPNKDNKYVQYCCPRNAYDFRCVESIKCCGTCPMLKQAYQDVLAILDDETKTELTKIVEDSKLFEESEFCKTCKADSCKKGDIMAAVNYVDCTFEECFKDPRFKSIVDILEDEQK